MDARHSMKTGLAGIHVTPQFTRSDRGGRFAGSVFWCSVLWLTLPAVCGQEVVTQSYRASWHQGGLEIQSPAGRRLAWWPVGASCTAADPALPAWPAPPRMPAAPRVEVAAGVTLWHWQFALPPPSPVAEQHETATFREHCLEVQVRVRWRGPVPRLVRLVYGGRLAAGCVDLDGLWAMRAAAADAPWLPAPVPGYVSGAGSFVYRRAVRVPGVPEAQVLALGGADDEDVCLVNGTEVGRTPLDRGTSSWETPRRYPVPATVSGAGPESVIEVRIANRDGAGGLWRGPCVLGPRAVVDAVTGQVGWTLASGEGSRLHHWCADGVPRPLPGRFTVSLTCQDRTREQVPENVTTGGRFQLPPYLVAIEGAAGWWGLGTLDLPRAEDGLRVEWWADSFSCPFLLATEAPGSADGWTVGPRLALLVGDSRQDILDRYLAMAPPSPRSLWEPWWSGPEYCTWGDEVYAGQLQRCGDTSTLTGGNLAGWLSALAERSIDTPIITLDAGWWQLPRDTVTRLHDQGRHVLLWTQPHWGPLSAKELADHPEWLVHDASGRLALYDASNGLLDFTVTGAREYLARQVRSYLAPEGWDVDGIKLDFAYTSAPVWTVPGDPAWGAGEQYRARVLRFVYDTVKAAKPGALLTGSSTNPLFGRVQDVCRLNEDWTADPELFRRRAATVLAFGEWAECDDWNAYEDYLPVQVIERAVWGPLTLMSSLYRGDRRNAPVPLSPVWASRLGAIFSLARQAPLQADGRCLYDPTQHVAVRTAADGTVVAMGLPLAGQGPELKVLLLRAGSRRWLASIADGLVEVAARERIAGVLEVRDDGTSRPVLWAATPAGLRLEVLDAAGPVSCYVVTSEPDR